MTRVVSTFDLKFFNQANVKKINETFRKDRFLNCWKFFERVLRQILKLVQTLPDKCWKYAFQSTWTFVNDVRLISLELIRSNHDAVRKAREAHLIHNGITWGQALFLFRFENYIPAGKAKRKESLILKNLLRNVFRPLFWLIDICPISQSKLLPLLVFLVCKCFMPGKNADWLQ